MRLSRHLAIGLIAAGTAATAAIVIAFGLPALAGKADQLPPLAQFHVAGIPLLGAIMIVAAPVLAGFGRYRSAALASWLAPALFVLLPAAIAGTAFVLIVLQGGK